MDPRDVDQATVLKQGVPAATLTRTSDGVRFDYRTEYLTSGGRPVASTLPLTDEPLTSPAGAVPAFFANLLPEGRRLTALRRRVKTSVDDELSLLISVGTDPVGDVQVRPPGDEEAVPLRMPVHAESFEDIDFAEILAASDIDPIALAGVQDKVSGRMITVPMAHQGRAHILKLTPPEYPRLVENEAFFLEYARRMKTPVVDAKVVHDRKGVSGLLVQRFDRAVAEDGNLRRLAVEDGAQLLNRHPGDKYNVQAEALATAIGQNVSSRPIAIQGLVRQLAYAWITGNGDQHAKNFSILSDTTTTLSPVYDIPSTVPYGDHTLALPVQGQRRALSRRILLAFAQELELPEAAAIRAIDDAVRATEGMENAIADGALGLDPQRARTLSRNIRRRRTTLET